MNIADICIIIVLMIFLINGYNKGFVKSVYSVISLIATLLILFVFEDSLIEMISKSPIGTFVGEFFVSATEDMFLLNKCSSAFIYLVSCIILYILIKFILKFALKILDSVASLPLLRTINKFLGMFIGLITGGVWVVIVVNILCVFPQTTDYILSSYIANYFNIIFI